MDEKLNMLYKARPAYYTLSGINSVHLITLQFNKTPVQYSTVLYLVLKEMKMGTTKREYMCSLSRSRVKIQDAISRHGRYAAAVDKGKLILPQNKLRSV